MLKRTNIAIAAAKEAGELLKRSFHMKGGFNVTYKKFKEPVSMVDYASNDILIRHINRAFPKHRILSEESDGSLEATISDGPTWIIDPLDGTSNFIAGIPLFGLTIAFVEKGVIHTGVIYDPIHEEMFVAERGRGAWLNGKRIRVSSKDYVRGAMLFAGRGYRGGDQMRHGKIIYALEKTTTYFRRLGVASLMLTAVASGRGESVILTGNKPWDTFAGVLLVQEAGGKVTDYCGKKWSLKSPDLVATNSAIHKKIVDVTKIVQSTYR